MSETNTAPGQQSRPRSITYDCSVHLKSRVGPSYLPYMIQRRQERAERQQSQRGKTCYRVSSPDDFDLAKFACTDNLYIAFRDLQTNGGVAAGVDSLRLDEFSAPEIYAALRTCRDAVLDRSYRPMETRSVQVPKPSGGTRTLQLHCAVDRALSKALNNAMSPWAQSTVPCVCESVHQLYARMQRTIREQQLFMLTIDDVRKCFDEVRIDDVMSVLNESVSQPDLLWLVETLMRGHEGPGRHVGIDQGSPWSPTAVELLLHNLLDAPFARESSGDTLLFRYADNIIVLSSDSQSGLESLALCKTILQRSSLTLKGQDPPPYDLRHPSHGHAVLGMIPCWDHNHLRFRIPEEAYIKLEQQLQVAGTVECSLQRATEIVNGFVGAYGPALTATEVPGVQERLGQVLFDTGHYEYPEDRLGDLMVGAHTRWIEHDPPGNLIPSLDTGDSR